MRLCLPFEVPRRAYRSHCRKRYSLPCSALLCDAVLRDGFLSSFFSLYIGILLFGLPQTELAAVFAPRLVCCVPGPESAPDVEPKVPLCIFFALLPCSLVLSCCWQCSGIERAQWTKLNETSGSRFTPVHFSHSVPLGSEIVDNHGNVDSKGAGRMRCPLPSRVKGEVGGRVLPFCWGFVVCLL